MLVPTFLLSTPNFSVGIIALSVVISTLYVTNNKKFISLGKFDYLVIFILSFYLIGAIPVTIYDGTTTRYFQGGIRLILCIPIYIALTHYLKKYRVDIREYLELGVIYGCVSTFTLAVYQFYYLEMVRVDGFLYSINFGYLACSLAFLAFSLVFNSSRKALLTIAFVLGIISVTLTLTRGAIFAIPILLTLIAILKLKSLNFKLIIAFGTLFIVVCSATYQYSQDFKQRIDFTIYEFSQISSGNINQAVSSGDRLQYWFAAIEAFKKNPTIGLPYDKREELNQELFLAGKMGERAANVSRGHAHSQYFEMIASNGLLGIVSIFTTLFVPLMLFIRHHVSVHSNWALPGAMFVAGFTIFGLTEVPLTANLIGSFYGFMLAIFFANISAERYHREQVHKQ
ncbi:O-antigen ligase family protein [Vibrio sp. M260118]|uniref:O-antigen ligase family protein n=1 Tax=Vibrio sp. M260118 TaxID=3020896 RepID=UPI002F3E5AD2